MLSMTAAILPLLVSQVISASLPRSSLLIPSFNASSNASVSDEELTIICDANTYGQNLRVNSCRQVFAILQRGDDQITFRDRTSLFPFDAPLPYRIQSPDGFCYIEVVLADHRSSGHASTTQFGQAAYTLFGVCVIRYGYGGIVGNIGGDNGLEVVIGSYKPNVQCTRNTFTSSLWVSCVQIFTLMRADRDIITFGQSDGQGVDIRLPLLIKSPDHRCQAKIDSTTRANSRATFYELWEAVNAISYKCVLRNEKGGTATKLGHDKKMFIEISDETPDPAQMPITPSNISAAQTSWTSLEAQPWEYSSKAASMRVEGPSAPVLGNESSESMAMSQTSSGLQTV